MSFLRRAMLRLRAIFVRRALENDMQEEMRAHLDQATERLVARGLSPADARVAARREFGNVTVLQDEARDARGARWVEALAADLTFAFRHFARQPLTTATIVTVLALGIGANTAIVSAIQAETMRPAPAVPRDVSHVRVWGLEQANHGARWQLRDYSYAELMALAARTETFSGVSAWLAHDVVLDAADSSGARGVGAEFVTPNFFSTLGVRLVAGPGFALHDPGKPDMAAVMSFATAEELFVSATNAIGRRVLVNEMPVRIVGVAPPRFQGAIPNSARPALWIPVSARAEIARTTSRWLVDTARFAVFARLAPAVTQEQATAIARGVVSRALPDSAARVGMARTAHVVGLRAGPPIPEPAGETVAVFTAMWVIALLILLVACTNVSSLLVAAAVARRHEIAVRFSLGASRARVLRQLLTESTVLAVTGGALGLLINWWITRLFASRVNVQIEPDAATVAFTMAFALGTGILFGLSPALHATRGGVAGALRDSGTGATRRSRLQRGFVAAQIVFSQPLLLLLTVMLALVISERHPIPDTVADHVISARFRPLTRTGAPGQRREAVDSLIPRIAAQPAVVGVVPEAAAFALRDLVVETTDVEPGLPATDPIRVRVEGAAPGYFALLDVPIILGRDISFADTTGTDYSVVIGSDLARRLWGDANPVGRTVASIDFETAARDSVGMRVVGVFDATRATTRGGGLRVYTAQGRRWRRDALLIRTRGPAQLLVPELQRFMRAEAPSLPVSATETLASINDQDRRLSIQIMGAAGAAGTLALLLASLGLYGVVSLAISQRRREIGIRIAVGGRPLRVAGMFFVSGVRLSATALAIGLPVSLVALRVSLSQGIVIAPGLNIWPLGLGIAFVLLAVAAAATWLPARRAARVDPASTLRVE